tara:strand:- start:52 stop:732 length:681 start_codon:yes stop_codon:yes gene_type:complete
MIKKNIMNTVVLFFILIFIFFEKIVFIYGKLCRPVYYNKYLLPSCWPLLKNIDVIKKEAKYALDCPINDISKKFDEYATSEKGKQCIDKISSTRGWVYGTSRHNIKNENWLMFGLIYDNIPLSANKNVCPKTCELLKNIKGINIAGFSLMKKKSNIKKHTDHVGMDNNSLSIHLGIIVPSECILTVNGKDMIEKEEKLFGFDSNYVHSAVNNSDSDRIILYIDKYI